ncbi:hypothetical protein LTR17_025046 [Elasticomyces elasticus]|nr:hypothetical protein LTR17_025046 [Elasticomyces elasticus]
MPTRSSQAFFAVLCDKCDTIFGGHWAQRQDDQFDDSVDEILEDSSESAESTEGSRFYEAPDWFHATSDNVSDLAALRPLMHYGVAALQSSAKSGCHLCSILWDQASDIIDQLEARYLPLVSQAIGIVIVRPEPGPADLAPSGSLDLQVSYFTHGDYSRSDKFVPISGVGISLQPYDFPPDMAHCARTSESTPSQEIVEDIRDWATHCQAEHLECRRHARSSNRRLPTRLVDVAYAPNESSVRLRDSADVDSDQAYATLSHCWGAHLPVRLLNDNCAEFRIGIAVHDLPRTFQDAIMFTRALSIRYLWIDSLCIIQDSATDWLHESLTMSHVYSSALLNLAATASTDGHGGLFRKKKEEFVSRCIIAANWTGHTNGNYIVMDQSAWIRKVDAAPLNSRAWVFQERFLAPRTVHFSRDQIWWECRETWACESYPEGMPDHSQSIVQSFSIDLWATFDEQDIATSNASWLTFVSKYTKTKLTRDKDRLIALAGVAEVAAAEMGLAGQDYVAGFWKHDLAVDLLWHVADTQGFRVRDCFVAPSWSWASINGSIRFSQAAAEPRGCLRVDITDINVTTSGGDFGPVSQGIITLRCILHPIHMFDDPNSPQTAGQNGVRLKINGTTDLLEQNDFNVQLDDEQRHLPVEPKGIRAYWCKFRSEGLILQKVGGAGLRHFERMGWLQFFHADEKWFESPDGLPRVDGLEYNEDGQCIIDLI